MSSVPDPKKSRLTLSGEFKLSEDSVKPLEPGTSERRAKRRIRRPFPTKVRGKDPGGEVFEIDCAVDNISSTGVYLRLPREIEVGARLDLVTKFENGQGSGATALLMCQVVRDELQVDGLHGLAMAINQYRFL